MTALLRNRLAYEQLKLNDCHRQIAQQKPVHVTSGVAKGWGFVGFKPCRVLRLVTSHHATMSISLGVCAVIKVATPGDFSPNLVKSD